MISTQNQLEPYGIVSEHNKYFVSQVYAPHEGYFYDSYQDAKTAFDEMRNLGTDCILAYGKPDGQMLEPESRIYLHAFRDEKNLMRGNGAVDVVLDEMLPAFETMPLDILPSYEIASETSHESVRLTFERDDEGKPSGITYEMLRGAQPLVQGKMDLPHALAEPVRLSIPEGKLSQLTIYPDSIRHLRGRRKELDLGKGKNKVHYDARIEEKGDWAKVAIGGNTPLRAFFIREDFYYKGKMAGSLVYHDKDGKEDPHIVLTKGHPKAWMVEEAGHRIPGVPELPVVERDLKEQFHGANRKTVQSFLEEAGISQGTHR